MTGDCIQLVSKAAAWPRSMNARSASSLPISRQSFLSRYERSENAAATGDPATMVTICMWLRIDSCNAIRSLDPVSRMSYRRRTLSGGTGMDSARSP